MRGAGPAAGLGRPARVLAREAAGRVRRHGAARPRHFRTAGPGPLDARRGSTRAGHGPEVEGALIKSHAGRRSLGAPGRRPARGAAARRPERGAAAAAPRARHIGAGRHYVRAAAEAVRGPVCNAGAATMACAVWPMPG